MITAGREPRVRQQSALGALRGPLSRRVDGGGAAATAEAVVAPPLHQLHRATGERPRGLVDGRPEAEQVDDVVVAFTVGIDVDRPTVTTVEHPEEDAGPVGLTLEQHARGCPAPRSGGWDLRGLRAASSSGTNMA